MSFCSICLQTQFYATYFIICSYINFKKLKTFFIPNFEVSLFLNLARGYFIRIFKEPTKKKKSKYLEIQSTPLSNSWVKDEIILETRKYLELNNSTNLWDATKDVIKGIL